VIIPAIAGCYCGWGGATWSRVSRAMGRMLG
jgi:hypothetical protein